MDTIRVITISEDELYQIIETIIERLQPQGSMELPKWLSPEKTLEYLNCGKTTLQALRNSGTVKYTQYRRSKILYEKKSLDSYLETHAKNTF